MTAPLREITGKVWQTTRRVMREKKYESKVIRMVTEEDQLYGVLSCGHTFKWYKSENHDKKKRLRCWQCEMPEFFAGTNQPEPTPEHADSGKIIPTNHAAARANAGY